MADEYFLIETPSSFRGNGAFRRIKASNLEEATRRAVELGGSVITTDKFKQQYQTGEQYGKRESM